MPLTSLGDMAQHFQSVRHNSDIKGRLNRLSQELSSGVAADLPAHLRGAALALADTDRRIALSTRQSEAARNFSAQLATMQVSLDAVDALRGTLADDLINLSADSLPNRISTAAQAARTAFDDIIGTLQANLGGESLFSGRATDRPALADADVIYAALQTAVAGALDLADLGARLDTFFDTSTGGFMTVGYLGDTGTIVSRQIDGGAALERTARADDPALRSVLKAAALGALAGESSLGFSQRDQGTMLRNGGTALIGAADALTTMRATVGMNEERADRTAARHAAAVSALSIQRNDMTRIDPFETATALQETESQLETHYTLTARLSNLSLVGFLR